MALDSGELHLRRVAETASDIRRDFAASGCAIPDEATLRRAADIVVSYPDAWPRYDAPPDDWDGRIAVATLWTWRKLCANLIAPRIKAA